MDIASLSPPRDVHLSSYSSLAAVAIVGRSSFKHSFLLDNNSRWVLWKINSKEQLISINATSSSDGSWAVRELCTHSPVVELVRETTKLSMVVWVHNIPWEAISQWCARICHWLVVEYFCYYLLFVRSFSGAHSINNKLCEYWAGRVSMKPAGTMASLEQVLARRMKSWKIACRRWCILMLKLASIGNTNAPTLVIRAVVWFSDLWEVSFAE